MGARKGGVNFECVWEGLSILARLEMPAISSFFSEGQEIAYLTYALQGSHQHVLHVTHYRRLADISALMGQRKTVQQTSHAAGHSPHHSPPERPSCVD